MSKKSHINYQNQKKYSTNQYGLSLPIEGVGEKYLLEKNPINDSNVDYHQPWNGYNPKCKLEHENDCAFFPVQTENIKTSSLYDGIEIVGDKWMETACEVAKESVNQDGGPFGAVILQLDGETNEIIRYWTNHNQVTSNNDPTAHAEVMAIRSACESLGVFNLGRIKKEDSKLPQPGSVSYCIIYSSSEPCPMCYSAIYWADLSCLSFAATRFDGAVQGVRFSDEEIYNELSKPYSKRKTKVYQCTVNNSLDSFNLWKRTPTKHY